MFNFGFCTLGVIVRCFLGIIRHENKLIVPLSFIFLKETVKVGSRGTSNQKGVT